MATKRDRDVLLAASAIEWHGDGIGDLVEDALALLEEIKFHAARSAEHGATIHQHTMNSLKEAKMITKSTRSAAIKEALAAYKEALEAAQALHEKLHTVDVAVKALSDVAPEVKTRDPFHNWSRQDPKKTLELQWTVRDLEAALRGESA